MHPLIAEQHSALEDLCRRHQVRRLALFGSAATGKFEPGRSDLDFLVEFHPLSPAERADAYFGLLLALQDLFHRPIDLVEEGASDNPYFLRSVERSKALLYAA
ncbi:DNA polymerase III subunit beta [Sulfurifustis variabilis]|uniref:DNA polymerase III subunit beta n=1 Tax=Sulfurifustis variabilis TaxID=1675686 RepID=A0A1B4VER2_9GAMM|nr:nucleotidyltransferase domain-containing protein [Sulfurifustis variabilis]BAU49177.1 DNA polymerase III subunit beta [Sulfurifustis variabilis]